MTLKSLINRFSNNKKLQNLIFCVVCVLTFLYIFSIPAFSNRVIYNIVSYVSMALLLGTSIVYILLFKKYQFDKKTLILPLFILFAAIGTLIHSHEYRDYLTLILLTITFYTLLISFSIINNSYLALQLIIYAFLLFSFYYLFIYRNEIINVSSYTGESFRLGWYFDNPNTIGTFMNIGISISLYLAFFGKKWYYYFFLLATGLFFFIGFTTGSRTFIILSILSVVLLVFFKLKKHWLIFVIVIATLAVLFIVLLNTPLLKTMKVRINDTIAIFLGTGSGGGTAGSTTERLLWQEYGTYFGSRHLLFGLGTNGFAVFSGTHTYTHGNFSEIFCDFGLIGFVLFYSIFLVPAVLIMLSKRKERYFVVTAITVFLLEGFLTVYYYSKVTYVLLAICYFAIKDLSFNDCLLNNKKEYFKKSKLVYSEYYQVNI